METNEEQELDIREYIRTLLKRRWTVITIFTLFFIIAGVNTYTAIPVYKATTRIVIEKENPNLMSIQEVMAVDTTGSDYYQTQYQIIKSRTVAREVIQNLNLAENEEFTGPTENDMLAKVKNRVSETISAGKQWFESIINTGRAQKSYRDREDVPEDLIVKNPGLVSAVINRIHVEPVKNSRLVDIGVEARDPVLAARMANEVVQVYISQNMETKLKATKDAVQWLTERIEDERRKVEQAENALLNYKERHEIMTDFTEDAGNIVAEKLAKLNTQVIDAESQRVEAQTRYEQAVALLETPEMLDSIPEVLGNELINEIKKLEVSLNNKMSELSKKYGPKHPQMIAIYSELDDLKVRKENEARRIVTSLENELKLAMAREESLKAALEKQRAQSLRMNKKAIQYNVLRRQAESSKHMYDLLINRFKETSLTEEMKTGNIRVIDQAEAPLSPVKPDKKKNMIMALFLGLALGVGFAFFIEYLDNTIKHPDDIKKYLAIPYLGPIPAFDIREETNGPLADLITRHSPKSTISESFRGVRTNILFSSIGSEPQVILVTSAEPSEGKTVTAANLAVIMAQSGRRTVLVDCDMRRPRIHKVFKVKGEPGLANVLIGDTELKDTLIETDITKLGLLTCGLTPPNPSEIIGSTRMVDVIESLKGEYDKIIIDSPPISAVTDSVVLAQMVDGIVMVIKSGEVSRRVVLNAVEQLRTVNVHIYGAVLNAVTIEKDSYYYYNQYHYSYYSNVKSPSKRSGGRENTKSRA